MPIQTKPAVKTSAKTTGTGVIVISPNSKNEELAKIYANQLETKGAFVFFARHEMDKKGKPKLDKEQSEYVTVFMCQSRNLRDSAENDESLNDIALGWNNTDRIIRAIQRVKLANFEADAVADNPIFQVGVVPMNADGNPFLHIKVKHSTEPSYDEQSARQVTRTIDDDKILCYITNEEGEPTYEITTAVKAKYDADGNIVNKDDLMTADEQSYAPVDDEEEEEEVED
jgi:hypothetical protein